jgi:hypothetical protein
LARRSRQRSIRPAEPAAVFVSEGTLSEETRCQNIGA